MAKMAIKGGPDLKVRLDAASRSGPAMQAVWAVEASNRMRSTAPRRTGRLASSIEPRVRGTKAGSVGVYGAYWGIFMDRGTKAHTIEPRKGKKALKWTDGGRTVFARKVQRRRMPRRPFITKAAQGALKDSPMINEVIQAWNRRRERGAGFRKF